MGPRKSLRFVANLFAQPGKGYKGALRFGAGYQV
jgi:hypothetical protein